MRKSLKTMTALGAAATLALAGAACEAEGGGATSPGQEAPADGGLGGDTGGDVGTGGAGGDVGTGGTDTGAGGDY